MSAAVASTSVQEGPWDTADLLEEAALEAGWTVSATRRSPGLRDPRRLVLESPGRAHRLCWPPLGAVRKSQIPSLVSGLGPLRPVETRDLRTVAEPPWLPCCLKPDDGSLGEGFIPVRRRDEWQASLALVSGERPTVVQPLLSGVEYRVTVCWDGRYAAARLDERRGSWCLWVDATMHVPALWVHGLVAAVRRLESPGVGFDVIVNRRGVHVLDANTAPNLAIHLSTGRPRDVPRAFLESWVSLCEAQREKRSAAADGEFGLSR